MQPTLKNILKYLLFIGLSLFLLWLAFRNTDPVQLMDDLSKAKILYPILSIIIGYIAIISRGFRWVLLLKTLEYNVKPWNAVHAVAVGYLANLAVPRAGEVARCTSLNQVEKIPVNRLFGTVVLERVVDFVMLSLILGLTIIFNFDSFFSMVSQANEVEGAPIETTQPSLLFTYRFVILGGFALVFLLLMLFRKKIIRSVIWIKVRGFVSGMKEGFKTFGKLENKLPFIFHSMLIWACYYFMIYVVFFAFPQTEMLTMAECLLIMVSGSLGIILPVPGGIGAYHYFVKLAFLVLGMQAAEGVLFATTVHASQTLQLLVGGIVGAIFLYFERRKKPQNEPTSTIHPQQDN